jgi:hypothetical protein
MKMRRGDMRGYDACDCSELAIPISRVAECVEFQDSKQQTSTIKTWFWLA